MSLQKMEKEIVELKKYVVDKPGKYLHVGCGYKIIEGFTNIDKYQKHKSIVNYDMFDIQMANNSVDGIYSSHSLEHLPIRQAKQAIANWSRLLRIGGWLVLAIPDLEEIMRLLLSSDVPEEHKEHWYLYTLFGYQVDSEVSLNDRRLDIEIDQGQFHTCGFTEKSIKKLLTENNFKIVEFFKYDGYRTPSMFIKATRI